MEFKIPREQLMFRWLISLLLCFHLTICSAADFDVVVVGTGPISLFEALYQHYLGKKVLVLEADSQCGGAWKSITVCGVPHADLGCHFMSSDANLYHFLQEYAGCHLVSLDQPDRPFDPSYSPNGFYPSQGCFELIDHLEQLIRQTDITLQLNCPLEKIGIDPEQHAAIVTTKEGQLTASKVIVTSYSKIHFNNFESQPQSHTSKFYHLYLLLEDSTPPRFSYKNINIQGSSRVMNLTRFLGLSGKQLIVFQIYSEPDVNMAHAFIDQLKTEGLIYSDARLLNAEVHNYEQSFFNNSILHQIPHASQIVEVLNTGAFSVMSSYVPKWTQVLPISKIIQ